MGLLSSESGAVDASAALATARSIQTWWNSKQASVYGFNLELYKGNLIQCCETGTQLFDSNYFASPPGPFKRAAAFVVIGRLNPFFRLAPLRPGVKDFCPTIDREKQAWLARIMALAIPAILRRTKATLGDDTHLLVDWQGFPSAHYKLEFLAWLRWLDAFKQYRTNFVDLEWKSFTEKRMARMVMATSLMIEACYYHTPTNGICGNISSCFAHLEDEHELDLIYDVHHPVIPPEFPPGE